MSETIDKVKAAAGAAGKSDLGEILFWSIVVGTPGVRRDELMTAMHSAGLDPDLVPDVVKPLTAANRAVQHACKDHGATFQVITDDAGRKIWAIVDPEIDKDAQLGDSAGTLQNRVGFVKDQASLVVEQETPLGKQAVELFRVWTEYLNGDDIRQLVHHYLGTWGAVKMIGHGGAYYIRPRLTNEVADFCQVINGLGDSEAFTVVLQRGAANQNALGLAARQQIAGEVARLKDEVAVWKDTPPRTSTIERRVERYAHLRTELGDFADILKLQSNDLLVELDTLRAECALMMGAGESGEETPAQTEVHEDDQEPLIPEAFMDPETGESYGTAEDLQAAMTARTTTDPTPPPRPGTPDGDPPGLNELRKAARKKGIAVKGLNKVALAAAIAAHDKANNATA